MTNRSPHDKLTTNTRAALDAIQRGFQPIPILTKSKKSALTGWTQLRWENKSEEEIIEQFQKWEADDLGNLGILCGEPSGDLIDVDIDHRLAARFREYFLPPTPARSGRAGARNSHYWYIAEPGTLPGTRRHKLADGNVSIELRSTKSQTVIPPSIHPTGEDYIWEGEPWGGAAGPTIVNGKVLAVQVAFIGLGAALLEKWPKKGSRHDAYLALAGGLLKQGELVHPYWERNLPALIRAMASVTLDDDGPETREKEVMGTTLRRIRESTPEIVGFGRLAEIIGQPQVDMARRLIADIEQAAGYISEHPKTDSTASDRLRERDRDGDHTELDGVLDGVLDEREIQLSTIPDHERDPLSERLASWEPVDLDPYLSGAVKPSEPKVLMREDGQHLMYQGRVNMLYGSSESAKSWIALQICLQEMARGQRVMFLDLEDEPVQTLHRLQALGAGVDDVRTQFTYIRPEEPLSPMQRNRWGGPMETETGALNLNLFEKALSMTDPSLIVVDGMTVLYGLHGLDTNDAVSTDVITGWLKQLTRNGRSTVVIIDHTSKGSVKGSLPIGSQHKVAMVQGSMLQVWPIKQPMPGAIGEVELIVLKDRPGAVRAVSEIAVGKAQVSARVMMDSREAGKTVMDIEPPRAGSSASPVPELDMSYSREAERAERAKEWEERVKHAFGGELGKDLSGPEIRDLLSHYGEPKSVTAAITRLVQQGWLEAIGATKGRRYVLQIGGAGYDSP